MSVRILPARPFVRMFIGFFLNATATSVLYTLSLHDALPISQAIAVDGSGQLYVADAANSTIRQVTPSGITWRMRSEEHTSELQSRQYLVCRLLLEKKKPRRANRHPSIDSLDTADVPRGRPLE